ncbi:MAG: TonB family protein [Thermoanaerobaculia bacterium]
MHENIDTLLNSRLRSGSAAYRKPSLLLSLSLHVVLFATVLLAPMITTGDPEPLEFVAVQIVPVQALGVASPAPAPTRKPTQAPDPPVKEAESEPEPEEPSAERVALPEPERKAKTTPKPKEAPRSEPGSGQNRASGSDLGQRLGSPLGSSLGTSPLGATVGGLDNPDFVYSYYVDQMLAMISANWLRPSIGGQVEAAVYFRIHRDGSISDVRVSQSSGYNSFDLAGLRAVQQAAPFPRLPQSYQHKSLGVNLILR